MQTMRAPLDTAPGRSANLSKMQERVVGHAEGEMTSRGRNRNPYITAGLRRAVQARDGNKCVRCGADGGLEIDHIVEVARGGQTVLENLQSLCHSCHQGKSAAFAYRRMNRNRRWLNGPRID